MRRKIILIVMVAALAFAAGARKRRRNMSRFYLQHAGTGIVSWTSNASLVPSTGAFSVSFWAKGVVLLQKASTGGRNWSISTILNQAIISSAALL